jgi:AraC-like DNA-binding protein
MRSWSTVSQDETNRLVYWREAICEAIFELDFTSADEGIEARMRQHDLGPLQLSDISISSAHSVVRSPRAASRERQPHLNLNWVRSGAWQVEHYGRLIDLAAGDMVLLDNRQPYSVTAQQGSLHMVARLPIEWIKCWLPTPEAAVARPVRVGDPWHGALVAVLDAAMRDERDDEAWRKLCTQQIGGALALTLGASESGLSNHTRQLYRRIQMALQERFFEHELDAAAVAAAVSISPRYLHKILAQEGTTYAQELFAVRLHHARDLLGNPRFAALSVSEIGWRSGFCDPSHFSRRFKAQFGQTPGQWRGHDRAH